MVSIEKRTGGFKIAKLNLDTVYKNTTRYVRYHAANILLHRQLWDPDGSALILHPGSGSRYMKIKENFYKKSQIYKLVINHLLIYSRIILGSHWLAATRSYGELFKA